MKKTTVFAALGCLALLAASSLSAAALNDVNSASQSEPQISVGHKLNDLSRDSEKMGGRAPLKTLGFSQSKAFAPNRGLSVNPRKQQRRVQFDEETALLSESFESCQHFKDIVPEGWSSLSLGTVPMGEMDHWIGISKAYADYFMYAPPVDGAMSMGVFYNDEAFKDEWLVSPEFNVPDKGYDLSFYWFTVPYYIYEIDRFHVDFDNKVFIDREILFNLEVLAKADGGEWVTIFDLEKQFADLEYSDLEVLAYDDMQRAVVNLDQFAGKNIQIAFRYFGEGGNTLTLDAVKVDLNLPAPEVSFEPDYSRLFFGFSPDDTVEWLTSSVEFYPVNHPITWNNTTPNKSRCDFQWSYSQIGEDGQIAWLTDNSADLSVTYAPDYSSPATLMNNFYYLPTLKGRGPEGGVAQYAGPSNFLQAGGTTEFDKGTAFQPDYRKYVATNCDPALEGYGFHLEECEELGFFAEPIFGKSVNTDEWWMHYCFPDGPQEGQYAYVDGFVNMFFPHHSAPMVVNAVSACAYGTITDDAEFTMTIYTVDKVGKVLDKPYAQKKIKGSDVIKFTFLTRDFMVLNFPLDEPVILDAFHTGYAYLVEISGYHTPEVEFFAPFQSMEPNPYEWCLSFYHIHHSGHEGDLTNQMSYVAFFQDDLGRDLYTSFWIGLDAHYPWLALDETESTFDFTEDGTVFNIKGYYDADKYSFNAPEGVDVKFDGRYNTQVTVSRPAGSEMASAPVTITAPGVSLKVDVPFKSVGVGGVISDAAANNDVYNAQGMLLIKNATPAQIKNLPAGLYIHSGRKILVK